MEEELLYLEPDEEITTIIDRLRSVTAVSVRLVVPKGGLVLQSLVSLKLLKREADRLGKEIALVTSDGVGLNLGQQAGISVFAKPKDAKPVFAAPLQRTVNSDPSRLARAEAELRTEKIPENNHTQTNPPEEQIDTSEAEPATNDEESNEIPDSSEAGIHVHHYTGDTRAPLPSHPTPSQPKPPPAASILQQAKKHPTNNRPFRPGRFLGVLVVLLVLGGVGYLAFMELAPRATLSLTIATEPFEQKVILTADSQLSSVDTANSRIPGKLLEAPVEVTQSLPATGKKQVGTKATATLSLSNYWDANPQSFPTGTTFTASDGTSFVSTQAATIPGATTTLREGKVVTTPGKTNVTLEASVAGTEANGKTGTFVIPSLPEVRRDKIYGETATATAGGTSREVTVISSLDLTNLTNASRAAAAEQGKTQLSQQVGDGRLLEGAYQLVVGAEKSDQEAGAEAETVSLMITGTMKGVVVSDKDITQATLAVITKVIPSGRLHLSEASDTLTTSAQNLNLEAGTVEVLAEVKTQTALAIDQQRLINAVAGEPRPVAEANLTAETGVLAVTIELRPRWLTKLPKRERQITFHLTYTTQPAADPTSPSPAP